MTGQRGGSAYQIEASPSAASRLSSLLASIASNRAASASSGVVSSLPGGRHPLSDAVGSSSSSAAKSESVLPSPSPASPSSSPSSTLSADLKSALRSLARSYHSQADQRSGEPQLRQDYLKSSELLSLMLNFTGEQIPISRPVLGGSASNVSAISDAIAGPDGEQADASSLASRDVKILLTTVYLAIFLIGVVGNLCNCLVIADSRNKYMKTATNYYLFSLSVSDLLLLIFGLPHDIVNLWHPSNYLFNQFVCVSRGWISEASTYASVLVIVAFTVERYLAICHPLRAHTLSRLSRSVKIIVCIWMVASSCALLVVLQYGVVEAVESQADGRVLAKAQCTIVNLNESIFELSVLIFFIVPMAVITILYVNLGYHLRKKTRLVRQSQKRRRQAQCNCAEMSSVQDSDGAGRPIRAASSSSSWSPWRFRTGAKRGGHQPPALALTALEQSNGAVISEQSGCEPSGHNDCFQACEGGVNRALIGSNVEKLSPCNNLTEASQERGQERANKVLFVGSSAGDAREPHPGVPNEQPPPAGTRESKSARGDQLTASANEKASAAISFKASGAAEGRKQSTLKRQQQLSRQPSMRLERELSPNRFQNGLSANSSSHNHSSKPLPIALNSTANTANLQSVIKMLVSVVVMFFICWAPFHAQRLMAIYVTNPTPKQELIYGFLNHISGISYYISAVVNPILYSLFSVKFRQAFRDTFGHLGCQRYCGSLQRPSTAR